MPELLLEAIPDARYDPGSYALAPMSGVTELRDGDVIDLGDRVVRVMHLPGHTPGSINLYEPEARHLFTGDVLYDGGLIDTCVGSDIEAYIATMRTLLELPVERAFPGHGQILDAREVQRVAVGYLADRAR